MRRLIAIGAVAVLALASATYQQAQDAVVRGAWDEAIRMISEILNANPRDLKALNLMGLALTGKGSRQEADRVFRHALEIDPAFYPARKNLAINELYLKEASEAERDFKIVLDSVPKDPVANMYMGQLAFARKDCAIAIESLRLSGTWLDKDARLRVMEAECNFELKHRDSAIGELKSVSAERLDPQWQFRAGYLLAEHGEYAEAVKFFEAARTHNSADYDLSFNLALCYVETKRFRDAIPVLAELRDGGHKTSEVDNLLAEAYEGDGETQQAIDTLREATRLAPTDERNYMDLAMLCADRSAFDLGLEIVNVGLHYIPNSHGLLIQRGVIYAMSGKFDLAERDFQAAGESDPEKDSAAAGLGLAYIEQGDVVRATNTLRERIREDPNNAALQYLLAESLIRLGARAGEPEFGEAQRALERSVRLNPQFVYSRVELAKLYLQQAKNEEAIQQLRAALEIDGTKVQVYAQLGNALRREGKTQEAAQMFARVRELNEQNRKHGERAPAVKSGANQSADVPDATR